MDIRYECINPILRVEDMEASLRFYVGVLGFLNAPWGDLSFTYVSPPGEPGGVYLCQGAQGNGGAWVWMGIGDVEHLHGELKSRGVRIRMEPTNFPWALEMQIEDPDGNVLRFGSEPRVEQ